VVGKALMRDPEQRYANAGEFLQAIERVAPAASPRGVVKLRRAWITKAGIAAAVVLLLPAAGTIRFWPVPRPAGIAFHIPPPQAERTSQSIAAILARTEKPPAHPAVRHRKASANEPEPPAPAPKKGFWSKLNPFKKKVKSAR
jgi:hypothetical protein